MGGDFNFVFCPEWDKTGGLPTTHLECRDRVLDWMSESDSVDIWIEHNPTARQYTWFSNRRPKKGKKYYAVRNIEPEYEYIACRLDFFLKCSIPLPTKCGKD